MEFNTVSHIILFSCRFSSNQTGYSYYRKKDDTHFQNRIIL